MYLVLDNYGTHKYPRYHLHFTPTGASWLNQVERWFATLVQKQIRRGSFMSVRDLVLKITRYIEHYNHHPRPFVWTKSADEIFETLYAMCKDISVSPHLINSFITSMGHVKPSVEWSKSCGLPVHHDNRRTYER